MVALGATGRGLIHDIAGRTGNVRNGDSGTSLDVQVKVEQAVMVDYHPKGSRKHRLMRMKSNTTDKETSSVDQWELSNVARTPGAGDV